MRAFIDRYAGTTEVRHPVAMLLCGASLAILGCSGGSSELDTADEAEANDALSLENNAVPLSVGHGVITFSDGKARAPTPGVIQHAQAALIERLASEASPALRESLEREVPAASRSAALNGVLPQGNVDLQQLEEDAEILEWLVERVDAAEAPVVRHLAGFLRRKVAGTIQQAQQTQDGVGTMTFEIATSLSGTAYRTECANAGVPNPPNWRSSSWVNRGSLTGSFNFLEPTKFAEVYTFTSSSPPGVCIALPRRTTSTSTSYSVVGIICQGVNSSRSCFWDSKNGQTITTSETNLTVPGTKFVGGAELNTNFQGVCTDCHAGENNFIIHPGSALELAPNTIAKNWVRPYVHASWPQNAAPGLEMISAGFACAGCHSKAAGRRFPRMEDLSSGGWCFVGNTATGNTMPVSPPHETALASKCTPRAAATRFNPTKSLWHGSFGFGSEKPFVGDFNGDGRSDILTFTLGSAADAYVALANTTSGFGTASVWHNFFGLNGEQLNVGDFNGDSYDDIIVAVMNSAGTVFVATSNGSTFSASSNWNGHVLPGEVYHAGDFNGDRKDDIAIFTKGSTNDVLVQLSNGSSFGGAPAWHTNFSPGSEVPLVGDFNADGYDDIVSFTMGSTNDAMVALSNGSSFGAASKWHDTFGWPGETLRVADMNGDGRDDIITFVHWSQQVFVALSTGTAFAPSTSWHSAFATTGQIPHVGDVNADHRSDGLVFTMGGTGDVFVSSSIP